MIRSEGPEKVLSGHGKEMVGPGDYEIHTKMGQKGVTKWHQKVEMEPRFAKHKNEREGVKPGPGHY